MTKPWQRRIPFKVDVAGVIHVMGSSLYSRPEAAIRELLQNAHDAIVRRRHRDLSYKGRIDIIQFPEEKIIEFHDDGIGLSEQDAEQYLGTLGIGITGILKGEHPSVDASSSRDAEELIGQFGIGLFSSFMLASRLVVESRQADSAEAIRWSAGETTDIELSSCEREVPGTTVRLHLKPEHARLAEQLEPLEAAVKDYADFLPIPIFINRSTSRANVIHAAWFDPTPDQESLEMELQSYFNETPLDVIPVRVTRPISATGAFYVTPERAPGFAGQPVVTVTVRHMSISRRIDGLLPNWASFLRGVLELHDCRPTASRENLVRDRAFDLVRDALEKFLFEHFEKLARRDPARMEAILSWHRYLWAGAALTESRVRQLLRETYKFPTSQGLLTFAQVLDRSVTDPIVETEFDRLIWYNTDRRQERWTNTLFSNHPAPCVHTLRSFEESLLAAMVADARQDINVDLRFASPSSPGFAEEVLGVHDLEDAEQQWQDFFKETDAKIFCASFESDQPVIAFLNERHELQQTFDDLKRQGTVPAGFQRLIDSHFAQHDQSQNEVLLNRNHRLVARALSQKTSSPLASVLRLLIWNALSAAGAAVRRSAQREQADDLDWIAEALWGRSQ